MTAPTITIQVSEDGEILNPEAIDEIRAQLASEAARRRSLLTAGNPDERYPAPAAEDFLDPATARAQAAYRIACVTGYWPPTTAQLAASMGEREADGGE